MKILMKSLLISLMLVAGFSLFAKTSKSDELRFQFGIGLYASTSNLLGLIENAKMFEAIQNQQDVQFIGLTAEESKKFNEVARNMQTAILVANILGSLEYGIKARILWHILIADMDFVFLPFDGSYNGRFDFMVNLNAGVRVPFFISPYITLGMTNTFSWYQTTWDDVESWKNAAYGVYNNFAWRPGLNTRVGLDFKFKTFSIGAYYQYTVKDFDEFVQFNKYLVEQAQRSPAEAAGSILGYQSRFGVALVWYLM